MPPMPNLRRDIKPGNFLWLHSGEDSPLKCIDFGLAERCGRDEVRTDLGVQVGYSLI